MNHKCVVRTHSLAKIGPCFPYTFNGIVSFIFEDKVKYKLVSFYPLVRKIRVKGISIVSHLAVFDVKFPCLIWINFISLYYTITILMLQWFMRVRLIAYHFNFFSECHLSIHFNVYSFYENGKQQMCIYNQVCLINIFFSLKVSKYKKNLQIVTNYRLWYHNLIISWGEKKWKFILYNWFCLCKS